MSHIIKFRAKNKQHDIMYTWEEILSNGDIEFFLDNPDEIIPMQFTGICDPQGTEVYEGDTIYATTPAVTADISINGEEEELYDFEATESTTHVVWNAQFARWDGIPFVLGNDPRFTWKVIGNIYEVGGCSTLTLDPKHPGFRRSGSPTTYQDPATK